MARESRAALLLTALLLAPAGCKQEAEGPKVQIHTPAPAPSGVKDSVAGRVTYHGVGLASGWVQFYGDSGEPAIGGIQMGGTYRIDNPPRGRVKVTVTAMSQVKVSKAPPATHAGNRLPPRYADPDTSGLTFNVLGGKQTYNIALED
jgi:hypothetical protein